MALGIDGVRSRMAELQARLDSLSPRPELPPPPSGGAGPTGSFADALDVAQNPLSGAITPNGSLGGGDQPMGIEGLEIKPTYSETELREIANKAAMGVDVRPKLFEALVEQESGFDPMARSRVGAMGLTQLMPGTARELGVKDPFDPVQNLQGGAKYLSQMLRQFNGNERLALAAYNAGPGRVQRYQGVPPIRETQNYVESITAKAKP